MKNKRKKKGTTAFQSFSPGLNISSRLLLSCMESNLSVACLEVTVSLSIQARTNFFGSQVPGKPVGL